MKSHFVLGRRVSAGSCSGVELHTSTNTFTQTELCPTNTIKSKNVDENMFCVFYRTEVTGSKRNTKTKRLKWFQEYKTGYETMVSLLVKLIQFCRQFSILCNFDSKIWGLRSCETHHSAASRTPPPKKKLQQYPPGGGSNAANKRS